MGAGGGGVGRNPQRRDGSWDSTGVDASLSACGTFFDPQFGDALGHRSGHATHLLDVFDELREEEEEVTLDHLRELNLLTRLHQHSFCPEATPSIFNCILFHISFQRTMLLLFLGSIK